MEQQATIARSTHTPGPWVADENVVYTDAPIGQRGFIADIYDGTRLPDTDEKIAGANARLIAAAPELLKLLQEVLEWNEDDADLATYDTAFRLQHFAETCGNRSAALRAAIAKATEAA